MRMLDNFSRRPLSSQQPTAADLEARRAAAEAVSFCAYPVPDLALCKNFLPGAPIFNVINLLSLSRRLLLGKPSSTQVLWARQRARPLRM